MSGIGSAVILGAGATLVMDGWSIARRRLLGMPAFDYRLLGRWVGHFARGRFRHERIAASPPIPRERLLGWAAHYLIGAAFAGLLLALWGTDWARQPTLAPALLVGLGTAAAPFLVMQPAMGAGVAASRTPNPRKARLQTVVTHAVFGFGLYAAAVVMGYLRG